MADVLYELCGQLGDEVESDGMFKVDDSDGTVKDKAKDRYSFYKAPLHGTGVL